MDDLWSGWGKEGGRIRGKEQRKDGRGEPKWGRWSCEVLRVGRLVSSTFHRLGGLSLTASHANRLWGWRRGRYWVAAWRLLEVAVPCETLGGYILPTPGLGKNKVRGKSLCPLFTQHLWASWELQCAFSQIQAPLKSAAFSSYVSLGDIKVHTHRVVFFLFFWAKFPKMENYFLTWWNYVNENRRQFAEKINTMASLWQWSWQGCEGINVSAYP